MKLLIVILARVAVPVRSVTLTVNTIMTEQIVLQVEDDDASSFVFREMFEEICPDIRLQTARNGVEALTIIRDINEDPSVRLDLVLLDVFLPLMNGFEVLASIRAVESFREIPVVVFTGQIIERDRVRCAELNAEYIQKPPDLRSLISLVKEICARAMQPR
jgi:CheY-like chemotaxis protein